VALDLRHQLQDSLGSAYTIERELDGGMSRVFVAVETRLRRRVVIKVLNPELAVSAERFERETRLTAQLQDPRIVPVLSAGDVLGLPYYIMPFVEGETLRKRMTRGRLPIAECVAILRDVALALEHAHARGVVHRDIKPENILLANNTAVVTDFGIAKAIVTATGAWTLGALTQPGIALGTPAYMAPEQALGDAAVDQRSDIYAWGVMAYELLVGEHPFSAKSDAHSMVAAHITESPPLLETRRRDLPSELTRLVDRTMRKNPSERPPNASELVRELGATTPVNTPAVTRARRNLAVRVGLAIGAIAVVIAVVRLVLPGRDAAAEAAAIRSLAVMPFTQSGDTTAAYLGTGMAEALTTRLAKLPNLRLIAPRTVSAAAGRSADPREIGRVLSVDAVLDGSIQQIDGQLRIRATLSRASDGTVIGGVQYDKRAGNMFELEDDVTNTIAAALRDTLSLAVAKVGGSPRGTANREAYDEYLRGRYAFSKRGERGLQTAIDLFERAIARDPRFARAHAGLAMAYVVLPIFSGALSTDSALSLALASGDHALDLDSSLADAHLAIAYARKMQWQWPEAERHFRAAAALSPDDAGVHHWYGVHLYAQGEIERSVDELRRAKELDPFTATIGTDGAIALYGARRLTEARAEIQRAFSLDTAKSDTWFILGLIHLARRQPDSAAASLLRARALGTGFDVRSYLSVAMRAQRKSAAADSIYSEVHRDYALGRASPYDMAVAAVSAGDRTTAIAAVERIVKQRDMLVTELTLPCDPLFDPLKTDPRFERLLASAGMKLCRPGISGS
jgi:eukaryotic-like serine/threonine-protein kinase